MDANPDANPISKRTVHAQCFVRVPFTIFNPKKVALSCFTRFFATERRIMTVINILVAVNVAQVLATRNLSKYTFMIDSSGHVGYGLKSGNEFTTTCNNGDTIVWQVISIDPSWTISIMGFGGMGVASGMIKPQEYLQFSNTGLKKMTPCRWCSRVDLVAQHAQYTIAISVQGVIMTFDPFIKATVTGWVR